MERKLTQLYFSFELPEGSHDDSRWFFELPEGSHDDSRWFAQLK